MKDVARHAGVSPQTVSNVINQRGKFGDLTRIKVLAAVETLGYQPSSAARSLRMNRTHHLALHILPGQLQSRNPLIVDLLGALIDSARARGYRITVFTTGPTVLRDFGDILAERIADGFILTDCDAHDPRARFLAEYRVPFVALGRTAADLPQSWVDIDNVSAAAAMVDHLASQGHQRIAFLGRKDDRYWTSDRLDGYRRGMKENGLEVEEETLARVDSHAASDAVHHFLSRSPRPTAIMADSDVLAAAAINTLKALGPGQQADVAVASFDGGLIEHISEPPAASIHIPTETIADRLIARCLTEIAGTSGTLPGEIAETFVTEHTQDHE